MNKKIIKDMFDDKLNKDKIHENILSKIGTRKNKNIGVIKFSLIPICALFIMVISLNIKSNNVPNNSNNGYNNILNINIVDELGEAMYQDIYCNCRETSFYKVVKSYEWLENINIPDRLDHSHFTEVLNPETAAYTGQFYLYFYTRGEERNSKIEIYLSPKGKYKPRCIRIPEETIENLDDSIIKGTPVKILSKTDDDTNRNWYYVFFNSHSINFDIEIHNLTEKELITLLESIIEG